MLRQDLSIGCGVLLFVAGACGPPDDLGELDAAIVGGEITEDYPEVVAIELQVAGSDATGLCSGTLITDEWVLTAAHCLDGLDAVAVGFGSHREALDLVVAVAAQYLHPEFEQVGVFSNDLGLVQLAEPVEIVPAAVNRAPFHDDMVGEPLTFVGWGRHEIGEPTDGYKRVAEIPLFSYQDHDFSYLDEGAMPNQGDSGGPAFYDFGEGPGVAGVMSFGETGTGSMGVSTRVDLLADWIEEYTGELPGADTDDDDSAAGDDDTAAPDDDDDDSASGGGEGGCACSATTRNTPGWAMLLVAAGVAVRRRPWISGK